METVKNLNAYLNVDTSGDENRFLISVLNENEKG